MLGIGLPIPMQDSWKRGGSTPSLPLLALNNPIVLFGNSIIAQAFVNAGDINAYRNTGMTTYAQAYGGSRLYCPPGGNLGVAGDTTADLLARVASVTALSPKCVLMDGGTNDCAAGTAAATIQSNLLAIWTALLSGGATYVVYGTILPRFAPNALTAPQETVRQAVNAWAIANAPNGVKVVNLENALSNWNTGLVDGLHPNSFGAVAAGSLLGAMLASIAVSASIFTAVTNQYSAAPLLAGTGGGISGATGVVADGAFLDGGGASGAVIVAAKNGSDQQVVTISGTQGGSGSFVINIDNGSLSPALHVGDVVTGIFGFSAAGLLNIANLNASIAFFANPFPTEVLVLQSLNDGDDLLSQPNADLVFRAPPIAVPTADPVFVRLTLSGLFGPSGAVAGVITYKQAMCWKV